ncbi:MAG: 50S ribosomal protein L22 [Candidatus Omnitrophica bacterium]|nr:50S ribosomal protein L22 [Candidatus Omnitrophota bacterium]
MIAQARGRFIPVSTRKVRLVARLIRGMDVTRAQAILRNLPKAACKPVSKILKSAVANATREGTWSEEQLMISRIAADEGPMQKRYRSAPMGRAAEIHKRMTHLVVELDAKKAVPPR